MFASAPLPKSARSSFRHAALRLLWASTLALLASACMISPRDEDVVADIDSPVAFAGYTTAPALLMDIEAQKPRHRSAVAGVCCCRGLSGIATL